MIWSLHRTIQLPGALATRCALALAFLIVHSTVLAQEDLNLENYTLGPGDTLVIEVFGEEDLSMEVMLDNTGLIDYPFLGTLSVKGTTISALEDRLLSGLKGPYLVDPEIRVAIKQYRSIYVNGEVEKPGAFPYEPGITVEKAIAMAGGFTERASRNNLKINRDGDETGTLRKVKLTDVVMPGDVLTVPQSFF